MAEERTMGMMELRICNAPLSGGGVSVGAGAWVGSDKGLLRKKRPPARERALGSDR